jgi:hypothetical protein
MASHMQAATRLLLATRGAPDSRPTEKPSTASDGDLVSDHADSLWTNGYAKRNQYRSAPY